MGGRELDVAALMEVKERMMEDFMLIRERDGKVELTALGKLIYRVTIS
ncbi:MAG: hypothetical protein RQ862_00260 [Candidatus Caldarchaeales archaeon]|jgi:hypothetical protein|nr:hypothetical protein [Candidatus Caldarchaeales archaeon]